MKSNIFFSQITDKNTFLNYIKQDKLSDMIVKSFLPSDTFYNALISIKTLSSDQEKLFISLIHYIDEKIKTTPQPFQDKIETILVSSIYIKKHYNKIKDYSLITLMSISRFSVFCEVSDYQENLEILTEEIFKIFQEKITDYTYYNDFIELTMKLHEEGLNEQEIINYFKCKTNKEILYEVGKLMDEIVENRALIFK